MEEDMKVTIKTIRKKDSEYLPLEMVEFTRGNGRMVSSMGEEFSRRRIWCVRAYGKMANGSNG